MSLSFVVIRYVFSVGVAGREPFAFLGIRAAALLAGMSIVFLVIAALMLRRQRYEHL